VKFCNEKEESGVTWDCFCKDINVLVVSFDDGEKAGFEFGWEDFFGFAFVSDEDACADVCRDEALNELCSDVACCS